MKIDMGGHGGDDIKIQSLWNVRNGMQVGFDSKKNFRWDMGVIGYDVSYVRSGCMKCLKVYIVIGYAVSFI